jgi:hypothetical protein
MRVARIVKRPVPLTSRPRGGARLPLHWHDSPEITTVDELVLEDDAVQSHFLAGPHAQ